MARGGDDLQVSATSWLACDGLYSTKGTKSN